MSTLFWELETKYGVKTTVTESSWNKGFSRFPRETYTLAYDENEWKIELTYVLSKADFSKPNPISTYGDIHQSKIRARREGVEIQPFHISYRSGLERLFSKQNSIYRIKTADLKLKSSLHKLHEIDEFYHFAGTRSSDFIPVVTGKQEENDFEITIVFNTAESPDIELDESLELLKSLLVCLNEQK